MAGSATYRFDPGLDPDELIRTIAYGQVQPLLKPGEQWSSAKVQELWARLAVFPAACVKIHASPGSARVSATNLRKQLRGTDGYEVKVIGCQVVVFTKTYLRDLPPPPPEWHRYHDPRQWMDMAEAREILGVTRARVSQLVRQHGVRTKPVNALGKLIYDRPGIVALTKRQKWRKRRAPRRAQFTVTTSPLKGMIG